MSQSKVLAHLVSQEASLLICLLLCPHKACARLFFPFVIRAPVNLHVGCSSFELLYDSICQKIWKTQQWPQDWKRSVFIPIPKKCNAKECSNYLIIALISPASKVMLKILQPRLQQYVNCELPDVQAGFRKGRGTRD